MRQKQTEQNFSQAAFAKLLCAFPKDSAAYALGTSLGGPYPAHPRVIQDAITKAPEWLLEQLEALQPKEEEV